MNDSIRGAVSAAWKYKVREALRYLEAEQDFRVLFAVESGSRAWGFHSPDSDYDVRFVYVRPVEWYLSINNRRDVFDAFKSSVNGTEFDDPLLDIVGWDITKTLHLLRKSNPQLHEWLNSTIVYENYAPISMTHLRMIATQSLDLQAVHAHYYGMATGNFREYLQGEMVRYKKYLYVIRPLLAAQFVRDYLKIPPVDFHTLCLETVGKHSTEFRDSLTRLLTSKVAAPEVKEAPRDPILNAWIEEQLAFRWNPPDEARGNRSNIDDRLDRTFRRVLMQTTPDWFSAR
jgi:predicted nucleotidyltransferase